MDDEPKLLRKFAGRQRHTHHTHTLSVSALDVRCAPLFDGRTSTGPAPGNKSGGWDCGKESVVIGWKGMSRAVICLYGAWPLPLPCGPRPVTTRGLVDKHVAGQGK